MKTWFITGASSGIGKGIAHAVLEQGDNAILTARKKESLQEFISKYKGQVLPVSLELNDVDSMDRAVKEGYEKFGTVDVLVNNAGHGYRAAVEEGEEEGIKEVFGTNFFGPVTLIKKILPQMRKQRSGAIINVSSIAAMHSAVGSGYYAASKAAFELVSDALYQELSPLGIKVMVVEPGAFRTRFFDDSLKGTNLKIEDYFETAFKTRKENVVNKHDQLGNPQKAGEIIVKMIQEENYPRTLLLGSDAVKIVRETLEKKLEEIKKYETVSFQTDYEKNEA